MEWRLLQGEASKSSFVWCVVTAQCEAPLLRMRGRGKGVGEGRKDGHAGRGASAAGAVRASLADPRLPPVSLGVAVCELPGILPAKVSEHRLGISFLCRVHVGSGAGKPGRPVFSGWRRAEPFSEVGSQSPRASWGGAVALRTRRNAGRAGGRAVLVNLKADLGAESGDRIGSDLGSWAGAKRRKLWSLETWTKSNRCLRRISPLMMDGVGRVCPVESSSLNSS